MEGSPSDASGDVVFDLRPVHALGALAAFSLIVAVFVESSSGWILLALCAAVGAWWVNSKHVEWPDDIDDALRVRRLSAGTRVDARVAGDAPHPPIPFRPMTISEVLTSTMKVLYRTWPTVVAVPAIVIAVAFALIFLMVTVLADAVADALASTLTGGGSLVALVVLPVVILVPIAFVADVLIATMSVVASDLAVRGVPVRAADVWSRSRLRVGAMSRLMVLSYGLLFAPMIALTAVLVGGAGGVTFLVLPVVYAAAYVAGILMSLSPVVMVLEDRGAVDSIRQSVSMCNRDRMRVVVINLLWSVLAIPAVLAFGVFGMNPIVLGVALAILIAGIRVLQVIVFHDIRLHEGEYGTYLASEWARNTGTST